MKVISPSLGEQNPYLSREGTFAMASRFAGWARKYRLSLLFAATAVLVISIATITVNRIIGDLTENNLMRIAEENTVRDVSLFRINVRLSGRQKCHSVRLPWYQMKTS